MERKSKILVLGIIMILLVSFTLGYVRLVKGKTLYEFFSEMNDSQQTEVDSTVDKGSEGDFKTPEHPQQWQETNQLVEGLVDEQYGGVDIQSLKESLHNNKGIYNAEDLVIEKDTPFLLGESDSLKVGYEWDERAHTTSGVEYQVGDRTRLGLRVQQEVELERRGFATQVDLSYDVTRNTSIAAGYRLLNFKDDNRYPEYWKSSAAAQFQLRF